MPKARRCRRVDGHSSSRSRQQCVNRPGNRRGRLVLARKPRVDHRVVEASCASGQSDVNSAGSIIKRLAWALYRSSRARPGCLLDDPGAIRTGRLTCSADRPQSLQNRPLAWQLQAGGRSTLARLRPLTPLPTIAKINADSTANARARRGHCTRRPYVFSNSPQPSSFYALLRLSLIQSDAANSRPEITKVR